MNDQAHAATARVGESGSPSPTWWVVFTREATDLWFGGKGLTIALIYSLVLGLWSYVMANNTELSLIPPKEMVWEILQASITTACFLCLVAAAESISGERERGALEALLLTPTSRREIVLGKFLATMSLWPGLFLVAIPFLGVLSQGTDAFGTSVLWGAFAGTLLVAGMTALGMLVSVWSNSLKASMFTALGIFVLIWLPFGLPGHIQSGPIGLMLNTTSPLMSTYVFLAKILVNNRGLTDPVRAVTGGLLVWHQLISPALFAVLSFTALLFASRGLRIEAGRSGRARGLFGRILGSVALLVGLGAAAVVAASADPGEVSPTGTESSMGSGLAVTIDKTYSQMAQGDSLIYTTVLTNRSSEAVHNVSMAMNIINLDAKGDIVDPEDWSPQRTQYVERLGSGASTTLRWRVNGILDGDFMLYMVAIPRPEGPMASSPVVSGPGIHMTISPRTKLNPMGILVYVIGAPLVLGLGMILLRQRRRRETEPSGTASSS